MIRSFTEFLFAALLLTFGCVQTAHAHHPGHIQSPYAARESAAIQLTTEYAEFNVDQRKGQWTRSSLEGSYNILPWLSLFTTLPFAYISENGLENQTGISDFEFGFEAELYESRDRKFRLHLGTALELPTGSVAKGLGGGHSALIPRLKALWFLSPNWVLQSNILYSSNVSLSSDGHDHGSHSHGEENPHPIMTMHSSKEVNGRLSVAYAKSDYFVIATASAIYGIQTPQELGPVSLHGDLGWRANPNISVILNGQIALAGQKRFDWLTGVGIRWTLPAPIPEPECGCADESQNRCVSCANPNQCSGGQGCSKE